MATPNLSNEDLNSSKVILGATVLATSRLASSLLEAITSTSFPT